MYEPVNSRNQIMNAKSRITGINRVNCAGTKEKQRNYVMKMKYAIAPRAWIALMGFLVLMGPGELKAQFTFTTNNGAITITGYDIAAGLNADIPASTNGYPVIAIGDFAFYTIQSITSVTIPNSITSIGGCAFDSCSDLTRVSVPNSVTNSGECWCRD